MAYVEEFNFVWYDSASVEHELKLLLDGGTGPSVPIPRCKKNTPIEIRRRGTKDVQLNKHILGSELIFNAIILEDELADYDPLFESEFKEWKGEFYINSVLKWVGYLRPDNFDRQWMDEGYFDIKMSFTDALASLKNIEFVNFTTGNQYTDRVSQITTIKRALEHVGFDLDFRVQINTWCTNDSLMTSTQCPLAVVTEDNSRFTKEKDGIERNDDCYDIIEKTLRDYNAYLVQHDGYYWIVNPQEKNSYYYPIDWATLTVGTRTANDLRLSITNYEYLNFGEIQKIRPLKQVDVYFRDRNVQDNLLTNGDFASPSTSEWTPSADYSIFGVSAYGDNYELQAKVNIDLLGVPSTPLNFYSGPEAITVRGDSDKIRVTYKLRCTLIDMDALWSGPDYYERVTVLCQIRSGSSTGPVISSLSGGAAIVGQDDSTYVTFTHYFPISTSGDYYLEFIMDEVTGSWADYDAAEIRLDDIYWTVVYSDGSDITFDRYYKCLNTSQNNIDIDEQELFFGDSLQDNDIGSLQISSTRTKTWSRYGKSENVSIQALYGQNILENFQRHKNYIRTKIKDLNDTIGIINLLTHDSRDYQIIKHTEVYKAKQWKETTLELVEVLNTAITSVITVQNMSSIDGQSTSSGSTQVSGAGVGAEQTLDQVTTAGSTTTNSISVGAITAPSIAFGAFSISVNGSQLEIKYSGTIIARITSSGYFAVKDNMEWYE